MGEIHASSFNTENGSRREAAKLTGPAGRGNGVRVAEFHAGRVR